MVSNLLDLAISLLVLRLSSRLIIMSTPLTLEQSAARIDQLEHMGQKVTNDLRIANEKLAQRIDRPKIPPPSFFTGKTGAAVDDWLHALDKQFVYYPDFFREDASKIAHAMQYMTSEVTLWWKATVTDMRASGNSIDTWNEFIDVLRMRYQPVAVATAARAKLDRCQQTSSVAVYSAYFQACMVYISDMSPADQVHRFLAGLKDAIRAKVGPLHPKNLSEAINRAVEFEAYQPSSSSGLSNSRGPVHYRHQPSASSGASAMDLNAIAIGSNIDDGEDGATMPTFHEQLSDREEQLFAMVRELQCQSKIQQQVMAMFGERGSSGKQPFGEGAQGKANRVAGVSKMDYERCRKEGRCLKCKMRTTHIASECPNAFSGKF